MDTGEKLNRSFKTSVRAKAFAEVRIIPVEVKIAAPYIIEFLSGNMKEHNSAICPVYFQDFSERDAVPNSFIGFIPSEGLAAVKSQV